MQQYYTLEQAAQVLRTTPEQLKEMARKNEVRAFQDRGSLRFRSQEIDELARARGYGSEPELPLGDAAKAGASGGKDVFNFSLDVDEGDEVPIGREPARPDKSASKPPSSSHKPGASKLGPRTSKLGKSSPPKASSDSDVRLVMDGGMDFTLETDSKAPASRAPISPPPKVGPMSPPPKGGSSKSRLGGPAKEDSGARIVPLDSPSDSDVKIEPSRPRQSEVHLGEHPGKTPSDSDIRIEEVTRPGAHDPMVTEEIDLDAEQRKADSDARRRGQAPKPRSPGSPALPTSSPFELSEADLDMDGPTIPPPARTPAEEPADTDSSSDFELKPLDDSPTDSSPLDLASDEEVSLGELTGGKGASGINLQDPADSGISLEEGSSEDMEFELSLDAGSTPKPAPAKDSAPDSSSEFELSLQEDDSSPTDEGSSEFELSLDPEGGDLAVDEGSSDMVLEASEGEGSSSEFELTLDESGGLSVEEEEPAAEGEDEVFETDFEVPALDEESGSEAVALDEADTDLESSEFDLSLEGEEESGSQVVPLEDEEEYEEGAATVQRPAAGAVLEEEEGEEGLEDIGEALDEDLDREPAVEEEEEGEAAAVAAAPAAPAEWGAMPALVLLPCTIVLFVVGLMSFELIQGMWGYHKGSKVSNLVIHPIAKMFDDKLPDE